MAEIQFLSGPLDGKRIELTNDGAIMGRNPNDSVVDADCRTHDHENLYIAGCATMPSASCINSTLSMVAVSLMMADRLKRAMKS